MTSRERRAPEYRSLKSAFLDIVGLATEGTFKQHHIRIPNPNPTLQYNPYLKHAPDSTGRFMASRKWGYKLPTVGLGVISIATLLVTPLRAAHEPPCR